MLSIMKHVMFTNLMWVLYFKTKLIYPSKKWCTLGRTLLSYGLSPRIARFIDLSSIASLSGYLNEPTGYRPYWVDMTSIFFGLCNEPARHQPYWADRTSTLSEHCNEPAGHQPYWTGRISTLSGLCNEPTRHRPYWAGRISTLFGL